MRELFRRFIVHPDDLDYRGEHVKKNGEVYLTTQTTGIDLHRACIGIINAKPGLPGIQIDLVYKNTSDRLFYTYPDTPIPPPGPEEGTVKICISAMYTFNVPVTWVNGDDSFTLTNTVLHIQRRKGEGSPLNRMIIESEYTLTFPSEETINGTLRFMHELQPPEPVPAWCTLDQVLQPSSIRETTALVEQFIPGNNDQSRQARIDNVLPGEPINESEIEDEPSTPNRVSRRRSKLRFICNGISSSDYLEFLYGIQEIIRNGRTELEPL